MLKKAFLVIVLLFSISYVIPKTTDASTFREVKQVSSESPLRVSNSPNANIVTTLPANTLVTQFSTVPGGWSYIQANQYKGYIATSILKTPKSVIKIASSKSGLVVKETATTKSSTVATLQYNMIVEDFGTIGAGWSFVQYGNVTGYVNSNFIAVPKTSKKVVIANDYLRNIASPSGINKGNVVAGTAVTEHSQIAGWSYVTTGNIRGYMPTKNLKVGSTTTPPVQIVKSFEPLRPSKISWMKYYINMYETNSDQVLEGWVEETSYHGDYTYDIYDNNNHIIAPASGYNQDTFAIGYPKSDFIWAIIAAPLTLNKPVPSYMYVVGRDPILIGNFYLRNTNATVTTPAGTFHNVVHIEEKYYNYTISTHYYFAPGYGLIRMIDSHGTLKFELRAYK